MIRPDAEVLGVVLMYSIPIETYVMPAACHHI